MRHDKDKLGLFLGFSVLVKESLKDPFVKTIFLFVAFSIKLFYFTFSSGRTLTRLWLAVENSTSRHHLPFFSFCFQLAAGLHGGPGVGLIRTWNILGAAQILFREMIKHS